MKVWPLGYRIGIVHSEDRKIKIAVLKKTCKGYLLTWTAKLTDNSTIVLPKEFQSAHINFSLRGSDVLLKTTFSEVKNSRHAKQLAENALESSLPFNIEDIFVSTLANKKGDFKTIISSWIVLKEKVKQSLLKLQTSSFYPDRVTNFPAVLSTILSQNNDDVLCYFLITLGRDVTCSLMYNNHLLATRSFPLSHEGIAKESLKTLEHMMGGFSEISVEAIKVWKLGDSNQEVSQEVVHLKKDLSKLTTLPVISAKATLPIENLKEDSWEEFGEALLTAYEGFHPSPIEFYQATEFSFLKIKSLLSRMLQPLLKVSLGSLLAVSLCTMTAIIRTKTKIKENLISIDIPLTLPKDASKALEQISDLRIQKMKKPSHYPILPTVPSVRHILMLFAHAQKTTPSLELLSLDYELTQVPSTSSPELPYQAIIRVSGRGNRESLRKLKSILQASAPFYLENFTLKETAESSEKLLFNLSFSPQNKKGDS